MGVKGEYRGGRRDPCSVDLGCTPFSTLKGFCPIPRHNPVSQACCVSLWTAQYSLAEQLYLQTQEMGIEEIPVLGLDPALLGSDPCYAIPRGVSDGTAAGSELGRIFS